MKVAVVKKHDGDDHGLDAVEHCAHLRQPLVGHVGPGDRRHDQHGRQDEADAGDEKPYAAGADPAHVHHHLGGAGAGDQVCGAPEIEKLRGGEPTAPANDLVLEHRDVRSGPAERDRAQLQAEERELFERA